MCMNDLVNVNGHSTLKSVQKTLLVVGPLKVFYVHFPFYCSYNEKEVKLQHLLALCYQNDFCEVLLQHQKALPLLKHLFPLIHPGNDNNSLLVNIFECILH